MMNRKQLEQVMKQLQMDTEEIKAKRVVIETESKNIIITDPEVMEVNLMGKRVFQVSGNVTEEQPVNEEDVKLVMEKTGASEKEVREALKKTKGDIAEAIMLLMGE
jgi:nascent polypeptide-associated complex subunit alpha